MGNEIELYNLNENERVVSPCLIIHGKVSSSVKANNIQIQHPQLPPLTFPINANVFKATILLSPGENKLTFITDSNVMKTVTCFYTPLVQNKPVHLCLIVAKDSPLEYDAPASQKAKEGGNGIDLAIKKLRVAGRMMQAFTNEQMLRNGFGHRVFNFLEEYTHDTLFRQTPNAMRNTIKVHIVRSDRTLREIRDPNVAQQNSKGNNTGALFGWAMDALKKYGGPFSENEKPVQAACIYLDTHWDGNMILGHAALGGGDDRFKLAIFGGHGLYSWPTCMEDIVPYFTDDTRSSTREVANDCNECGTHWECLGITMGAFLHEIGHSLGSPHEINGIMLRDYTILNRSFLTKEAFSTRTNSYGSQPPIFPKEECTWNRLDLLRYLYHKSFTREYDYYDPSFMKQTMNIKSPKSSMFPMGNETCRFTSSTGIYLIEVITEDLTRGFIEYLPKSLGGEGPQKEVVTSLAELKSLLPPDHIVKHGDDFSIRILAVNADDLYMDHFPKAVRQASVPLGNYGFPKNMVGFKSEILGSSSRGKDLGIIPCDITQVTAARVYHGGALDGVRFYLNADSKGEPPEVPPRSALGKLTNSLKVASIKDNNNSVLVGNQTNNYTDIVLEPNEIIVGFNVRCGQWVDAIQIITNQGRLTNMLGNSNGGSLAELKPPSGQHIVGFYGRLGQWLDGIGIVYGAQQ